MAIKWLFFDCMETLVDFDPVPQLPDYAAWAYHNSGVEDLWNDYDHFHSSFTEANHYLATSTEQFAEWSSLDRFRRTCTMSLSLAPDQIETTAKQLQENFFKTYHSKCIVHPDVEEVLPELAKNYQLGVVSNFKIKNGIKNILTQCGLIDHFKWVLTSSEVGWRKPSPIIYQEALKLAGVLPQEVLFVGDDANNDVMMPEKFGMHAVLLDRDHANGDLKSTQTIESFFELQEKLQTW
jgi:putative hydrolase of the HAD superfamily